MIKIEAGFSEADLRQMVEQANSEIMKELCGTIAHRFKEAVAQAQELNTYKDQTAALRNSIGCIVYLNGELFYSSFGSSPVGSVAQGKANKSAEGQSTGEALAKQIAEEEHLSEGIVAVLVAGMKYAKFVEDKGFDVLTGSTLRIQDDLDERLQITIEDFLSNNNA